MEKTQENSMKDQKPKDEVPIHFVDAYNKSSKGASLSNEDSSSSEHLTTIPTNISSSFKRLPPSAPIDIPKRKVEPLWIENTGWVKYQEWYRRGPTY